jgi:outer membrane protein assembly factor BamA
MAGVFCCLFLPGFYFSSLAQQAAKRKSSLLVLPVVSRSVETDWNFGLAGSYTFALNAKDSLSRTSSLQGLVNYSLRKQLLCTADGIIYFPKEKYVLSSHLSYSYFPDKFWGIGNSTPDANEESYDFRQFYVYLHGQRLVRRKFFVGLIYEFQRVMNVGFTPGGLFDQQDIAGRDGYSVSGLGVSVSHDKRNNAFWPTKGSLVLLSFSQFDKLIGSDFRYTNFITDARFFRRIAGRQVLAAQLYGSFNTGRQVPLRSMASLGGSSKMRGYYDGRYRDKNLLLLQAEYRIPLWKRWGLVAFGGAGNVGRRLDQLDMGNPKISYGGGLRFAISKKEKMNLRVDYGWGKGGNKGFYIQFGEAF